MRILLYSGKGGVGKTSVAAATGVRLAQRGYRTLVMSVDPAHSLSDVFDLGSALFDASTSRPRQIMDGLEILEVNVNAEVKRHWGEVTAYITSILRRSGLSDVEAEEIAIFPGMEELSAMLYVNQYCRERTYEVIVLDMAPTAESVRFVSLPTTLQWYMEHVFGFERAALKAVRPIVNLVAPVQLPPDGYFQNIKDLFEKISGIDKVLEDPQVTSVRLVTNPEKMVVRETQRAFVYFSLHGMTVDTIIVNRVLPKEVRDTFFRGWRESQRQALAEIERYFSPVPAVHVPLFRHEVIGRDRLEQLADQLYGADQNPARVTRTEVPYTFLRSGENYEVRIQLPFTERAEVELFKKDDGIMVQVGALRRYVGLPTSMAGLVPAAARLEERSLVIELRNTR
jgi:arsenite-transporting ATPase